MKFSRVFSAALTVVLVLLAILSVAPTAMAQNYGDYRSIPGGGFITNGKLCFEATQMSGPVSCVGPLSGLFWSTAGSAATSITTTSATSLTVATAIPAIPGGTLAVGKQVLVVVNGRYTNGAASLLTPSVRICQVAACASGTVVTPAGCTTISTNQASVLTNGQWSMTCLLSVASIGASTAGTAWAHEQIGVNLGAAVTAAQSVFQDQSTAVSAGFDTTVNEFLVPSFTFATSNAGNTVTVDQAYIYFI